MILHVLAGRLVLCPHLAQRAPNIHQLTRFIYSHCLKRNIWSDSSHNSFNTGNFRVGQQQTRSSKWRFWEQSASPVRRYSRSRDSQILSTSTKDPTLRARNSDTALYGTAFALCALALSYAAVPLYRIYCQSTGKANQAVLDINDEKIDKMVPIKDRKITVQFSADTASMLAWDFKPTQGEIKISPGETALAFYTAKNPTTEAINGVATYSVMPFEAGQYLNKIQCFCFEEQRLNPGEEVDMPVFFYFDPEFAEDPRLENVESVVLSYCFFAAKEGFKLPFMATETKTIG